MSERDRPGGDERVDRRRPAGRDQRDQAQGQRGARRPGGRAHAEVIERERAEHECGKQHASIVARRGIMRRMRILHTMLRVGDLERSIAFYRDVLGMQLLSRKDYPEGKFTLAFMGYGKNPEHAELELTHNWDTKSYELGNAYGHIALGVDDIYGVAEKIRAAGGNAMLCACGLASLRVRIAACGLAVGGHEDRLVADTRQCRDARGDICKRTAPAADLDHVGIAA